MRILVRLAQLLTPVLLLSPRAAAASNVLPSLLDSHATRFAVHSLPNVSFPLSPSWAGLIPIPRASDHRLFFWLFQAESDNASQNLIIWLNGGPGCSSMIGLTFENGPLKFDAHISTPCPNPYSWTKLANVIYLDQPIGTGYSTGNKDPSSMEDITSDFYNWLKAFYDHFPSLRGKDLYIMGESYAGVYIPYFAQAILSGRSLLPLNLKAIALGDAVFGNGAAMSDVVTTTYLRQQASYYGIPKPILSAFDAADRQCGFDRVLSQLTYPPKRPISIPGNPEGLNFLRQKRNTFANEKEKTKRQQPCSNDDESPNTPALINASINAACSLGCATFSTAMAYLNSTYECFNPYNVHYDCDERLEYYDSSTWLNQPGVKKAIHAPDKAYQECNQTVFDIQSTKIPEPPAYKVLPGLLAKGVKVHVYSGDWDLLLNHWGTELVLQNMTWNNRQGFQSPPNRTFIVNGTHAANWGYERGLSYHHILRAGHMAPHDQPRVTFEYVRDFVVGKAGYAALRL